MSKQHLISAAALTLRHREVHWSDGLSRGLPENFDYSVIRTSMDAFKLIVVIPNSQRGVAAREIYLCHKTLGKDVAYSAMISVWEHDHVALVSAFGSVGSFISALREVAPARRTRRQPIRAWRGGNSLAAAYGISWTTDRDIACWFSMYSSQGNGTPFVFYCDLAPVSVVAEYNGRGERELIVDPAIFQSAFVYLDDNSEEGFETFACDICTLEDIPPSVLTEWREGAKRFSAVCKARTDRLRVGNLKDKRIATR